MVDCVSIAVKVRAMCYPGDRKGGKSRKNTLSYGARLRRLRYFDSAGRAKDEGLMV